MKQPDKFLRLPEVAYITGLSGLQICKLISESKFPKQHNYGARENWLQSEILKWMDEKLQNSKRYSV